MKLFLRLLLFITVIFGVSCNMYKDKNSINNIAPGNDSSMMIHNDSGMNRGNPKIDTVMNHGGNISIDNRNDIHAADSSKLKVPVNKPGNK